MSASHADSWRSKLAQTIGSRKSIMLNIGQSENPCCNDFHLNRKKQCLSEEIKTEMWNDMFRDLHQDSAMQGQNQK